MPARLAPAEKRRRILAALDQPGATLTSVAARFQISRPTLYEWRRRLAEGGPQALTPRSHRPHRSPHQISARWREELFALRQKRPTWGAKKLLQLLRENHPRARRGPALRTVERWLQQTGRTVPRPPRARRGPELPRPTLTAATQPNHVWTLDFKGWFRTADRARCEALTVRDLASRYLLGLTIVAAPSDRCVRRVLRALFQRQGLPRCIRVDNGAPFAGQGPLGLSSLSVWWLRLGITVEFTRPGCPQDNGAHEQMHRVLKAETANPPALNRRAQQRRFARWQHEYNTLRPHEALHGRRPAQLYTPSPRRWSPPRPSTYPAHWLTRCVRAKGGTKVHGRLRSIGQAFARQVIGLEPIAETHYAVYLDTTLLGHLYLHDAGAMRPCLYRQPLRQKPSSQPLCKGSRGGKV